MVPVVFRFRNRRIGLPRIEIIGLADTWVVQPGDTPPTPGSREELTLAAEWSRALSERMETVWREGCRIGGMSATVCPFIAIATDSGKRLSGANAAHACFAQRPSQPIELDHQERLCLTATFS